MKELPTHAEAMFGDAIALPAAERAPFLARACGADRDLLTDLLVLVAAHERSGSILDQPPAVRPALAEEVEGAMIGRYQLLRRLGEGGCGVVWLAQQQEPIRRQVALKVIKLGMDTKAVVARFEAERQALAMMDHPGIARIFDAGTTLAGRPFFVMEVVPGIPITKFSDNNRLTPAQRLGLFVKVCQAVQHAHERSIVHRDLKPSNILVGLSDGEPIPKVIDFGIAKAMEGRLTDASYVTAFEHFIGTPAYMSPEQAEMSSAEIDARSDIYSLGVLLYELLTGQPAFDAKQLANAGLEQVRRLIREVEPARPSARLKVLGADVQTTIAHQRSVTLSQLGTQLKGELDWIVMRCLEKDRRRRYETTQGLTRDIERYLRREPIAARPPSPWYVLRRFISRHQIGFAAAGTVAAVVFLGAGLITAQAFRAFRSERAQNELRASARQAELEAAAARTAAEDRKQRLSRIEWARQTALPEIDRLLAAGESRAAFKLAQEAREILPDDPTLSNLWPRIAQQVSLQTNPPGATISWKPYRSPNAEWTVLGVSPIDRKEVPRDAGRWRMEMPGFATLETATAFAPPPRDGTLSHLKFQFVLDEIASIPPDMVRVDPTPNRNGDTTPVPEPFFIDRFEVTNRQFKVFVDRGGYQNPRFWRQPFVEGNRVLAASDVIATFVDATGKPGPSTWRHGTYPEGRDDYPVTGVSWYEAAAYAEFAGRRLPSLHHWTQAATPHFAEMMARFSNFNEQDVAAVGAYQAVSIFGAYDLAGNVKEWCWNEAGQGTRYILGGCWSEPVYMFLQESDALPALDRSATNGFRCALLRGEAGQQTALDAPVIKRRRDDTLPEPVSDETFEIYRRLHAFDRTELEPWSEGPADLTQQGRRERISFRTAYGSGRMNALIFLPKDRPPPYQTVILFPGSGAMQNWESSGYRGFILRSGRALVVPSYQAMFERSDGRNLNQYFSRQNEFRSLVLDWSKDLTRTIDYLQTRPDIRPDKLAYLGFSLGGALGFIIPSVEKRMAASILVSGGIWNADVAPEIHQANYAPRVTLPTLMVNGRFDFVFSQPNQEKLFRLLGTPAAIKRHVIVDSGHVVGPKSAESEVLAWLDRFLGPVQE